jgi:hypothetical protein
MLVNDLKHITMNAHEQTFYIFDMYMSSLKLSPLLLKSDPLDIKRFKDG